MVSGMVITAGATAGESRCFVRRLKDPEQVRALLDPHRVFAAFALAQLEKERFKRSEWWLGENEGEWALVMHSRGWPGNALTALGSRRALAQVLALHPGPAQTFATFEVDHIDVMHRFFTLNRETPMLRMVVTRETFQPFREQAERSFQMRPLSDGDIHRIDSLYASERGELYMRLPRLEGVYFGMFMDGSLIAVAGTHAVSEENGIAVIGNVFTHPFYRNRHIATELTSAVSETLLARCPQVVLTVEPENAPAVSAYLRLGYEKRGQLIEGGVTRREALGVSSLLRRLAARLRGPRRDRELSVLKQQGNGKRH